MRKAKIQQKFDLKIESIYAQAFAFYQGGKLEDAENLFQILCRKAPVEARFWFGLGAALQQQQKYQSSLRAWAVAALLTKQDPYPHFHAAECLFSLGNQKQGLCALGEAQQRVNANHPLRDRIIFFKEYWGQTND